MLLTCSQDVICTYCTVDILLDLRTWHCSFLCQHRSQVVDAVSSLKQYYQETQFTHDLHQFRRMMLLGKVSSRATVSFTDRRGREEIYVLYTYPPPLSLSPEMRTLFFPPPPLLLNCHGTDPYEVETEWEGGQGALFQEGRKEEEEGEEGADALFCSVPVRRKEGRRIFLCNGVCVCVGEKGERY